MKTLGFTGTRNILTQAQMRWLHTFLDDVMKEGEVEEVHHGGCTGADLEMHLGCVERGIPLVVHPPVKTNFLAVECVTPTPGVTILEPKPYLTRDRDIVMTVDGVVGMPSGNESDGGGTWYTINYAVRVLKPAVIVHPDGHVEQRISNPLKGFQ